MASYILTITGPDLSRRGMKTAFRRASAHAMAAHRRRFLPLHFRQTAISRYPTEYKEARNRKYLGFKEWLKSLTPAELKAWRESQKRKTPSERRRGSAQDPQGVIPLVESGRLERVVTVSGAASVNVSGDLATMRITGLPFYTDIRKSGEIDKQAAMQATTPEESAAYGQVLGRSIQQYFDSK